MLENVQSPLIEPVTDSDLLAIVQKSLNPHIELTTYRQLTGGLFNTSYYITTRDPDYEIVLRIAPSVTKYTTLFDYEKTMMGAEAAIYALMRDADIPVPDVLVMDVTGEIINRHFMMLHYLESTPMNDLVVADEHKPVLRQQLGTYLRRMHSITHDHFGRVQPDGTVEGDASWRVVFSDLFAEAVQRCRDHALLDDETLRLAEQFFDRHADLLDDPAIRPALIHGDLWDANVLLTSDSAEMWQIGAIIDVDRALFADRLFEAALWHPLPEFQAGYGIPLDQSDAGQSRLKLYQLFHDLFHVFVFGIQIPVPDVLRHHQEQVRDLL